jgi:heat shock protein HslJ
MKQIALAFAAFFMLSGRSGTAQQETSLYGRKWMLEKVLVDSGMQRISAQRAFIKFDEKNSAGGNAGCNTFGSRISAKGNLITIRDIFSTKMFCEDIQLTEDAFLKQLGKVTRYEIKGKDLCLYQDKTLVLAFREERNI